MKAGLLLHVAFKVYFYHRLRRCSRQRFVQPFSQQLKTVRCGAARQVTRGVLHCATFLALDRNKQRRGLARGYKTFCEIHTGHLKSIRFTSFVIEYAGYITFS